MIRLALAAASLAAVLAGCQDPVMQKRSLARQRAVATTVQSLDKRELQRPKDVRGDLLAAQKMIRDDERTRIINDRNYIKAWKDEVRRWRVRQPEYAKEAGKVFAGDMKRAHDTAVQVID